MILNSVVLMAGFSRRMGQPKQHVILKGRTFLHHITSKLQSCSCDISKMIFVSQENDTAGADFVKSCGGVLVLNNHPEDGPLSSIRLAIEAADDNAAIMLWPTDHPMISSDTVKKLISEWKKSPEQITVPSDGEHRGHPTIFPNWCFEYFKTIDLNKGAKAVMQMFPEKINHVCVDDMWITKNINTPELLQKAELSDC